MGRMIRKGRRIFCNIVIKIDNILLDKLTAEAQVSL